MRSMGRSSGVAWRIWRMSMPAATDASLSTSSSATDTMIGGTAIRDASNRGPNRRSTAGSASLLLLPRHCAHFRLAFLSNARLDRRFPRHRANCKRGGGGGENDRAYERARL